MSENIDSSWGINWVSKHLKAREESGDFKWYIARTLTGHENKVIKALRERILEPREK